MGRSAATRRARLRVLRYVFGMAGGYVASGTLVLGADRVRSRRTHANLPAQRASRARRPRTSSKTSMMLECGHVLVRPVPAMLPAPALRDLLTYCDDCGQLQRIASVALLTTSAEPTHPGVWLTEQGDRESAPTVGRTLESVGASVMSESARER